MTRKKLRFPMFFKFLVGCLTLAGILIVGSTLFFQSETRLRNRGDWMRKHLRRYHGYQERVGNGMTGTLELLASDARLAAALTPASDAPADPTAPPPPPRPDAAALAEEMHKHLMADFGL